MRFLENLNRILVGTLVLLVMLQAGLLFFMKNMEDQAQFRLVQNKTNSNISCAKNPFSDEFYWPLSEASVTSATECEGAECSSSLMTWNREQNKELHVISVQSAPAFRWGDMDQGGLIKVRVKKSDKPQIISLISRKRLEWNFQIETGARIEKIVVATPELVWVSGLPDKTPIEYLSKDKMCSYPYSWQEAFNPDNEFRVLVKSLETVTGLVPTSFQGAVVGREFRLPAVASGRQLASLESGRKFAYTSPEKWMRQAGHVVADTIQTSQSPEKIKLPEKTAQVLKTKNDDIFIVADYRLQRWNKFIGAFEVLRTPMFLPETRDVTGMALDPRDQTLFVYNDQRGGELYKFNGDKDEWALIGRGYNYNFQSFYFDESRNVLIGLHSQGSYLSQLVYMDQSGQTLKTEDLKARIPFDKKRWRWALTKNDMDHLAVWVRTPARPEGFPQQLQ